MIIAATGHRPPKLGGYDSETMARCFNVAHDYLSAMRPAGVISGMALGWDQEFASAAIVLNIPVHAAVPFDGQERQWPQMSQHRYKSLLACCTSVTVVSPGHYSHSAMQTRNIWMVDRANRICALFDGSASGTRHCIDYALRMGRDIDNLWTQFNN